MANVLDIRTIENYKKELEEIKKERKEYIKSFNDYLTDPKESKFLDNFILESDAHIEQIKKTIKEAFDKVDPETDNETFVNNVKQAFGELGLRIASDSEFTASSVNDLFDEFLYTLEDYDAYIQNINAAIQAAYTKPKVSIFKSFLYKIGIQEISKKQYTNNINVSLITKKLSFLSENEIAEIFDKISVDYKSLQDKKFVIDTYLTLSDLEIKSVNKDTLEPASNTVQGLRNIPAKEMIFTSAYRDTNTKNCPVYNDLEFSSDLKPSDIYEKSPKEAGKYFQNEYNFSNQYDKSEYQSLNISLDLLTENKLCLNSDNFILNESIYKKMGKTMPDLFNKGICYGLIFSYTEKKYKNENMIPIAYYEFGTPININNNSLEIEFNINGLFSVE